MKTNIIELTPVGIETFIKRYHELALSQHDIQIPKINKSLNIFAKQVGFSNFTDFCDVLSFDMSKVSVGQFAKGIKQQNSNSPYDPILRLKKDGWKQNEDTLSRRFNSCSESGIGKYKGWMSIDYKPSEQGAVTLYFEASTRVAIYCHIPSDIMINDVWSYTCNQGDNWVTDKGRSAHPSTQYEASSEFTHFIHLFFAMVSSHVSHVVGGNTEFFDENKSTHYLDSEFGLFSLMTKYNKAITNELGIPEISQLKTSNLLTKITGGSFDFAGCAPKKPQINRTSHKYDKNKHSGIPYSLWGGKQVEPEPSSNIIIETSPFNYILDKVDLNIEDKGKVTTLCTYITPKGHKFKAPESRSMADEFYKKGYDILGKDSAKQIFGELGTLNVSWTVSDILCPIKIKMPKGENPLTWEAPNSHFGE
jgi:hypothetical protein